MALLACMSSFLLSPIYCIYSGDIHHFIRSFKVPSHRSQELVREEVRRIIEDNNLPYVIDSKESEERTKIAVTRHMVQLKKEVQGIVEPMEVGLVLKSVSSFPNVACDPKEYCSIAL